MFVAYIDGGSRGNPGPAGFGVRIENPDGTVCAELKGTLGIATNNVAEYRGLIAALTYFVGAGHSHILIKSDSQLLIRQMTGRYRVRHPNLQPLHREAQTLLGKLERVDFEHVPRTSNTDADRLANQAMDESQAANSTDPAI
ncbi:MAG: ribonuclease HI family protein [Acidobacteriota bacterium]|nr:ribonuclease HI family protein [Acidobacteriota bacterium]